MLEQIKERLSQQVDESKQLKKKIAEKKSWLETVEEKFIMGEIKKELHDKYTARYEGEIQVLSTELGEADINSSNLEKAVEKCLQIAQDISTAWLVAQFENTQRLQKMVYPDGILYNKKEGAVRTLKVNGLLMKLSHW